jgi:hypothetical protein
VAPVWEVITATFLICDTFPGINMKSNKLYNFINRFLDSIFESEHFHKDRVHFTQDLEQHNYVLYDLTVDKHKELIAEKDQQLTVKSHHISFYENQDDKNPYLSQYHYTAYLVGEDEKAYQLHVYFNQNDQLTTSAVFSIKSDDNTWVKQEISAEFSSDLSALAIDKSFIFMSELRRQYQNTLDKLENHYNTLEQELEKLSFDLVGNDTSYQKLLQTTLNLLNQLSDCHPNTQYDILFNLFTRIQRSLREIRVDTSSTAIETHLREKEQNIENTCHSIKKQLFSPHSKKPLHSIIQRTVKLQNIFLSLPVEATHEEQLKNFLAFLNSTQDALIATEDNNYHATLDDLKNLQTLMTKINHHAKNLLTRLLLRNRFDLAESLKYFLKFVCYKLVTLSLTTGNAKLLDFLLSNSHFAINTFLVFENLSPVLFCYLKHSQAAPKTECLSILIKHNASIMSKTADGFSVAHHILSATDHPLKKALTDNSNKTLRNPQLFKGLIYEIKNYSNQHEVNKITQDKLQFALDLYKQAFKSLCTGNILSGVKWQTEKLQQGLWQLERYPIFTVDALKEDKDVQAKNNQYEEAVNTLRLRSKREKIQAQQFANKILKRCVEISKYSIGRFVTKEMVLNEYDKQLNAIMLISEFLDNKETIRKSSSKKISHKTANALNRKQQEILAQLKKYVEPYQVLTDDDECANLIATEMEIIEEINKSIEEVSSSMSKIILSLLQERSEALLSKLEKNEENLSGSSKNLSAEFIAESLGLCSAPVENTDDENKQILENNDADSFKMKN